MSACLEYRICVEVESDLNVSNFEEVETTAHIVHESYRFIDLVSTLKNENISESDFNVLYPNATI